MFTKEYVREVLTQMVSPYMEAPLSDEFVDRIYDGFVAIRNDDAIEHRLAADSCQCRDDFATDENGNCSWCHKPRAAKA